MAAASLKPRFHSSILSLAICAALALFTACGGDTAGSASESNNPHTGSASFRLVFNSGETQSPAVAAASPSGDICRDYGIQRIDGQVLDSSGAVIAAENFDCSEHQGVFTNIPVGIVSVSMVGVVNHSADIA